MREDTCPPTSPLPAHSTAYTSNSVRGRARCGENAVPTQFRVLYFRSDCRGPVENHIVSCDGAPMDRPTGINSCRASNAFERGFAYRRRPETDRYARDRLTTIVTRTTMVTTVGHGRLFADEFVETRREPCRVHSTDATACRGRGSISMALLWFDGRRGEKRGPNAGRKPERFVGKHFFVGKRWRGGDNISGYARKFMHEYPDCTQTLGIRAFAASPALPTQTQLRFSGPPIALDAPSGLT